MPGEVAAAHDGGGPADRPEPSWLILQRLDDLRRETDRLWAAVDGLRQELAAHRQETAAQFADLRREARTSLLAILGMWLTLVGTVATLLVRS